MTLPATLASPLRHGAPRSILVIIENPAVRELLASHLQHARLLPIVAASTLEGQRLACEVRPDAVLVDADSPATADWITLPPGPVRPVPTVVLSSRDPYPDGAQLAWIAKPFSPMDVVRCLKDCLGERPARADGVSSATTPERTLRLGPLELDLPRHEVRVKLGDRADVVSLPRAELELLRCLIEHQGRVVSREQIIAAIWGTAQGVDARTVDQNVKRLRQHLGSAGPLVQTRRGYGYRINVAAPGLDG